MSTSINIKFATEKKAIEYIKRDSVKSLKKLLDDGLSPNSYYPGNTLLEASIKHNAKKCNQLLIDCGAEIDKDAFTLAIERNSYDVIENMSKKTNKSYNMDIRLHDKNKKYVETLQYLLDTGWNIEEKSCIGNYLFQATYSNKIKFLDLFLNHKPELINSRDYHNATILFYSNYWITKYLIDKGIDVNAITDNNNNALHYECSNKNYDIRKIKLLVESGIDVNLVNEKGNTPIDIALDKENYDIFEYLTSKGAEYDKNDSRILTTIHSKIKNLMSNNNLNNQEVKNKLLEINSKFHNQLQSL